MISIIQSSLTSFCLATKGSLKIITCPLWVHQYHNYSYLFFFILIFYLFYFVLVHNYSLLFLFIFYFIFLPSDFTPGDVSANTKKRKFTGNKPRGGGVALFPSRRLEEQRLLMRTVCHHLSLFDIFFVSLCHHYLSLFLSLFVIVFVVVISVATS